MEAGVVQLANTHLPVIQQQWENLINLIADPVYLSTKGAAKLPATELCADTRMVHVLIHQLAAYFGAG